MASKRLENNLVKLGIDMASSQMQVFRAVLIAAGGTSRPVDFGDISSSLETIVGKPFTKAYIYRRLHDLEENGFISVDTIHTPRTYTISESGVADALDAKRREKLSEYMTKKQEIAARLSYLKSIRSQQIVLMLHHELAGKSTIQKSMMVQGIENVRSTIIREFADEAKEGDLVRVLGHVSTMAEGLGPSGVTELKLLETGFRGVRVKGLLTPYGDGLGDMDIMAGHIVPIFEAFQQVAKTGNLEVRILQKPVNTYRIVSLNEDKMLLYLTHGAESNLAALVHKKDNPGLVNDAIRTFDKLFETGIDSMKILEQLTLKKVKS